MITFETQPCMNCEERSLIDLDEKKFQRWTGGEVIQNVWPELSAGDRELLITGTHPSCWDSMFSVSYDRVSDIPNGPRGEE